MDAEHERSAADARAQIERGAHDRLAFRAALLAVPPAARDAWVDRVLGLGALPADGPDLPRGCVPYIPCGVDELLAIVDGAAIDPDDLVVDIGSGVGRALGLVHLLAGAAAIGVEIQSELVRLARDVTRPLSPRIAHVHGDAAALLPIGSVFLLYCPFGGERLARALAELEAIARTRPIRVCTVDLPLPPCAWLAAAPTASERVAIYRS